MLHHSRSLFNSLELKINFAQKPLHIWDNIEHFFYTVSLFLSLNLKYINYNLRFNNIRFFLQHKTLKFICIFEKKEIIELHKNDGSSICSF